MLFRRSVWKRGMMAAPRLCVEPMIRTLAQSPDRVPEARWEPSRKTYSQCSLERPAAGPRSASEQA